mgnify:CR=1 FL=1
MLLLPLLVKVKQHLKNLKHLLHQSQWPRKTLHQNHALLLAGKLKPQLQELLNNSQLANKIRKKHLQKINLQQKTHPRPRNELHS